LKIENVLEKINDLINKNRDIICEVYYEKNDDLKIKINHLIYFFEEMVDKEFIYEKKLNKMINSKDLTIKALRFYKRVFKIYKRLEEIRIELIEILESKDNNDYFVYNYNTFEDLKNLIKSLKSFKFKGLKVPEKEIVENKTIEERIINEN